MTVNSTGLLAESVECVHAVNTCQFIFNVSGQSFVELSLQCILIPMDHSRESVEQNGIFCQLLVLVHPEVFEFKLHLSDHIVRTKILGKLCGKQLVVRENQMVFTIQDHRLEPL